MLFGDDWHRSQVFYRTDVLPVTQPIESGESKQEKSSNWPQPFFIHHLNPEARNIAPAGHDAIPSQYILWQPARYSQLLYFSFMQDRLSGLQQTML